MHTAFRPVLILAASILALASCQKDNDPAVVPASTAKASTVSNLATVSTASTNGAPVPPKHYTFYSLADNKEVAYTDSNSTKWDIAVRATIILINGGTSGPGQGGAQLYTGLFTDLKEALPTGYNVDAAAGKAIPTGSGNGWYTYNSSTNVVTPIAGKVLAIRTATGKYAKVEVQSYYKDAPAAPTSANASGYYTFRYVYQGTGTSFQ